ncbi:glycosyltransferase [Pseudothermotoga sp.]
MEELFREIERCVSSKDFSKAKELAQKIEPESMKHNMLGVLFYQENKLDNALEHFQKALKLDPTNDDVLFNLSKVLFEKKNFFESWRYLTRIKNKTWEVYDLLGDTQLAQNNVPMALHYYSKAAQLSGLPEMREKFEQAKAKFKRAEKIAIFCLPGLDNFIKDIAQVLSNVFEVKLVVTTDGNQIVQAYKWADIVWLEWANELAVEITNKLEKMGKKIVCRLHSYEALTNAFLGKIDWKKIDTLVLVAEHMREVVATYHPKVYEQIKGRTVVIHNGLDLNKFKFKPREKGYNIAVVAHINYKKDPAMWLQVMGQLVRIDPRYNLSIAGDFQDLRYHFYFTHLLKETGLEKNVVFHGYVKNIEEFLEDKNFVLSTSVHEGHPYNIMEAMALGIKPLIHNYCGAKDQFPRELVFNFVDEIVKIMLENYESEKYREFIENNYPLEKQMHEICVELEGHSYGCRHDFTSVVHSSAPKASNVTSQASTTEEEKRSPFEKLMPYLSGEKFSSSFEISLWNMPYLDRISFLEKKCRGKNVAHIGFADHKDLIMKKLQNNVWLHKRLLEVCNVCYGIDIDCQAVEFVRNTLGISNVYCLDLINEDLPYEVSKNHFDYVLLPEVIEHLDDPVLFLKEIRRKFIDIAERIIVTVPNAFRLLNFHLAMKNSEGINTDHRYWFTPYTILKLIVRAGFEPEELFMADLYPSGSDLPSKIPILREDIILIAKFRN